MKRFFLYCTCIIIGFFSGCVEVEEFENSTQGNFEALWKIMDENYCFFEYKDVDWDQIYLNYKGRLNKNLSQESLFTLLCEMLSELKDGHVNLSSSFDYGRYWSWYEDFPSNYNEEITKKYLGTDYLIAGGMRYKILNDNVGYIRYTSFSSKVGETNLDYIIDRLSICSGIIIDVRENGGGYLDMADRIASRFVNEKTLVGYIQHKTGKGHNDFSEPIAKYLEPSNRLRYQKPVIVITNRHCYSATNDFVNAMTYCPNVKILGDRTGGGSGLPFSSELPNGWGVRFSACPMYNANMKHLEFGIEPDIYVELQENDILEGKDTLIEEARKLLKE
ncbi:S41 family peptidase [Bacteroidales bacterium OttesenSCG-928-M11]|nr:S41 family peptidase [Bacteroidales bacterium OttesenSCG-928-M11]